MKRFLILLLGLTALSLAAFVLAQASSGGAGTEDVYDGPLSSLDAFEAYFFRFFRVVDAPCPSDVFGDTCYLHDYDDIFDFKDRFGTLFLTSNFSEGLAEMERWALMTTEIEGEEVEFFRATYCLPDGESFTLIFSPRYIFLEQ